MKNEDQDKRTDPGPTQRIRTLSERLVAMLQNLRLRAIAWQESHSSPVTVVIMISFVIGIVAGFSATMLKWVVRLLTDQLMSPLNPDTANAHLLYMPLAGILLVSMWQRYLLKRDYSRGTRQIIMALVHGQYRISPSVMWNSVLTCAVTIGFGCSAGTEGPAAYSGAAIGSNVGRFFGLSDEWLRILIGIGAGAGIAGIFKAPMGGALFTLEVLQLPMQTIPVVCLIIACLFSGSIAEAFSNFSFDMSFSNFHQFDPATLGWVGLLGIFCGLFSMVYNHLKDASARFFISVDDPWQRNILAGSFLSLSLFLFPPLFGEGMPLMQSAINGEGIDLLAYGPFAGTNMEVWGVLLILLAMMLIKGPLVSAAYYGGGVAGDFMPTLFCGALAGYFVSVAANTFFHLELPVWYMCLVGMGAMMSGALHAPIMSLFISCEVTNSFQFMPAYIVASFISYITVKIVTPRSWNQEVGHDDMLSLQEISKTPGVWRSGLTDRLKSLKNPNEEDKKNSEGNETPNEPKG